MKMSVFVLLGAALIASGDLFASGWLETGISSAQPFSSAQQSESGFGEETVFDAEVHKTETWSPVRLGLGGSKNSFTNKVCSLPYVWSNVYGLQVEVISCACDVYGIQLALAGAATSLRGIQLSLGNFVSEEMWGVQLAPAFSVAKRVCGLQLGGASSMADEMIGLQAGLLSSGARTSAAGLQLAAIVNTATICDGLQIGLFNFADEGSVLQLGLWNVYGPAGDSRRSLPLVNAGW